MPNSKMLFVVPQESARLAEILADHGGYLEYESPETDFTDYLAENVGQVLTAEFEDLDDPSVPLYEFGMELDKQKAPFLGCCNSREERSRGDRYEGYVVFNIATGSLTGVQQINFPWREGEPGTDDRSLQIAGVAKEDRDRILSALQAEPATGMKP